MAERPEDLNLPGSIVSRIVKDALPDGTKVSKEAQQAIAKAASVFVLYATSCSNQIAQKSNRKTIHGQDVISAMEDMEFDKFIRPLEANLEGKIHYVYYISTFLVTSLVRSYFKYLVVPISIETIH